LNLREVDSEDLWTALKGATDEMKDRIFTNVSERVGTMMKAEMDFSCPVRMSDVEEVQLRIVQTVRQLEEPGRSRSCGATATISLCKAEGAMIDHVFDVQGRLKLPII
jgi:hypothetical protein